ncbi:tetratricopeptide repeat protein [Kordiimonas aquimaris]|uniref:tetratricopeptide repeat protein n=1 Tax=Kordiimonas aquimaris TaxID=707591 RepID=UPI0021D064E7|nr:tetratricopeptide repeat protein [Kordiimonas aquimaris]
MKYRSIFLVASLILTACSNDDSTQTTQNELGDVAAYTSSELKALVDSGDDAKVIRIIAERAKRRLATARDYILLADIHITRLDGAAAELALDQANTLGATRQSMALPLAKALMLQQRFDDARTELQLVPFSRANGVELNLLEGEIAHALGNPDTARQYFGLAREIEPSNHKIDTALALLEMSVGNFDVAKELAQAAIEKNSAGGDAKPYYILGAINRLEGNSADAIPHLQRALIENSDDLLSQLELIGAYLDVQQIEQAETVLDGLISVSPNNMLAQFYVAYILAEKGENQAAEDVLLQARDLLTRYQPAKRLYGHIAYGLDKYDTASDYLQQYLAIAPGDTETRLILADTHTKEQRPQEALKVLEPILEQASNKPLQGNQDTPILASGPTIQAFARAAEAQQAAGNIEAAREQYEAAISLASGMDPADPTLVSSLTAVLASMEYNTGAHEKGLALMRQATAGDSATAKELTTLANMQMLSGEHDGAFSTAQRLKANPETKNIAQNIIGAIELRRGNYNESIAALSEAIAANPNYASALKNRATAYLALNQYENALPDLLKLKPQAEGDGQYFGMLGRAQLGLKNYVAAIDAYATAREIVPNSALFAANYASSLGAKGRYAEAIAQAKEALKLSRDDKTFQAQVREMLTAYEAAEEERARNSN